MRCRGQHQGPRRETRRTVNGIVWRRLWCAACGLLVSELVA